MRPRGLTKTSRRVWTLIRILALLFAIGLARQFATNVLSLHDILSDDQKTPSAHLRRGAVSSRSEQAPSVPPVPVLGELETDDPETNSVDEEEEEDDLRPRREEVKVEDDVSPVLSWMRRRSRRSRHRRHRRRDPHRPSGPCRTSCG